MRNACEDTHRPDHPRARRRFSVLAITGAAALAIVATPTMAQDSADFGIEEIVVTASKRGAQLLQSVPAAIQAVTGETLENMGIADFTGIAGQIPSLFYQDLGPGDREYVIRGINSTGAATVGVYYDETVITARNKQDGGGRQADIKLYDLERIEILKGPQGTLYGASSMSGTIRLITRKPDPTQFEGRIEGEFSGTHKGSENWSVNGMFNLPIIDDRLAIRVVGWKVENSGYIDQVRLPLKNINDEEVEGARITIKNWFSDDTTLTASYTFQNTDIGGSSRFTPTDDFFAIPVPGFPNAPGCDLCNVDFNQSPWSEDINIWSATFEHDGSSVNFLATTNWFERGIDFAFDSTPILFVFGVPIPAITLQPQYRRIWSNEVRLASRFAGPVQFVFGGFLAREKKNFAVRVITIDAAGNADGEFNPLPGGDAILDGGNTFFGRIRDIRIDQEAIFGELSYDVMEDLIATVGLRWFKSSIVSNETNDKPFVGFPPDAGPEFENIRSSDTNLSLKFNVSYQATPDHLLYLTAAEGFREGGVNDAGIPEIATLPREFQSDSLWNYEAGAKTSWLDNRLVFNAAVYFTRWKNMQVEGQDPTGAFTFKRNAGKASVDGIEFDLTARPTEALTVTVGGSWQDARLTEDSPAATADPASPEFDPNAGLKGDNIPNVPDWQFNFAAQYDWPLKADLDGFARVDFSYRGSSANQFRPTSPFFVPLDDYALVNVRFGVAWDTWRAIIYANNLFDTRAQVDAIRAQQDPLAFLTVRPRTAGVIVSSTF